MPVPTDFSVFFAALGATGLPYCATDSVASGIYGEPRMTMDIDLVLLMKIADIGKVRAAFPEDRFYIPPVEILTGEARRGERGLFNVIHHDGMLKADIFIACRDPLHLWVAEKPASRPDDERRRTLGLAAGIRHPAQTRMLP